MKRIGIPTEDTRDTDQSERFLVLTNDEERRATRADLPQYWYHTVHDCKQ